MKKLLPLLSIFGLALFLRLAFIDQVPVGITHDELDYYMGGKFLALTGSDFTGSWKWWHLAPMNTGTITAELTPLYYAPIGFLLNSSLLAAKLTPALFGSLLVIIMYWLMYRLSKGNRKLSLVAALLTAINPWSIIFSRTGYEVTFAIFWYALSVVSYLSINYIHEVRRRNILFLMLSLVSFFLGYFSYHGFKFLAPFIVLSIFIGIKYLQAKSYDHKTEMFFSAPLLLLPLFLLIYSMMNYSLYSGRVGEINFLNLSSYTNAVNLDRSLSIHNPFIPLLINKLTASGKELLTTYFQFFSLERLFLSTKDNFNLTFPDHGYFYLIDIILISIGFSVALRKKQYYILFFLLLAAPVPSVIHRGASYAIRSSFAMVPLILLSAIGLYTLLRFSSSRILRVCLLGIMLSSVGYFSVTYLYRYSVISSDQYMINFRLLSAYLSRSTSSNPTMVITDNASHLFREYLFYGQGLNQSNVRGIQQQFSRGLYADYVLPHLTVTSDCSILKTPTTETVIVDTLFYTGCLQSFKLEDDTFISSLESQPSISIRSPIDSREYYRIYNPSFCTDNRATNYIKINSLSDLKIEQMSDTEFCNTWIF